MPQVRKPTQFHDGFEDALEPIEAIDLDEIGGFADMLRAYQKTSFGARRLGEAFEVMQEMIRDPDCYVVCTVTGAMTVAKMGLVLCEMIERGYIDCIVSTGALQAHGMIEGTGMNHFKYRSDMDDSELFDKGYDRVYDTLELEKNLDDLEIIVRKILDDVDSSEPLGSHQICSNLGKYLHEHFPGMRGILKSAYEHDVPVFIPAFTDSELGLDFAVHNRAREKAGRKRLSFDPFIDLDHYTDIIKKQKRTGIFTIGGGVPRNWAQQVGPYLEITRLRLEADPVGVTRFHYGVRICPESEHWGGLSGCTYSEGMSWGKFVPVDEGGRYAEVLSDATVVWPILVKALMETIPKRERSPDR